MKKKLKQAEDNFNAAIIKFINVQNILNETMKDFTRTVDEAIKSSKELKAINERT